MISEQRTRDGGVVQGTQHKESPRRPAWDRYFDQVVGGVADGIIIVDESCHILHANEAAERLFGMSKAQLIGRCCDDPGWKLSSPDGTPLAGEQLCCYRALKIGETSRHLEQTITRPDGSTVTVLVSASPLRDDERRITGAINSYTDITELKQAEQALRQKDEHNRSLLRLYALLGQANSYTAIVEALLSEIPSALGYESVWLQLVREDSDDLLLLDAGGPAEEAVKKLLQMDERLRLRVGDDEFLILPMTDDPYLKTAVATKGIHVVEDARTHPLTDKKIVEAIGNRTIVAVPLVLADRRLGVFSVGTFGDEGVRPPSETQLDYLTALSNHVAVAVDRVRFLGERRAAEEALRESEAYSHSLLRLYETLGQANSYSAILQALLGELPRTLGYGSAGLLVLDEGGTRARLLEAKGSIEKAADSILKLGEEFRARTEDEQFLVLPIGDDPFLKEIVEAAHIVVVEDARTDPRTNKEIVAATENRTIINVPLMLAGKKLGILNTGTYGDDEGVKPPTERQLEYLAAMANHVAVAMDRVRFLAERRKAEAALRESESRLRDIIGNTNAIIYLKDLDGRFLLANDQFARLFGTNEHEIVGKTGYDVFPSTDMALELDERERHVRETGKWFGRDETMRTPLGERTYSSVMFPLRDSSGAVYAVCGVSTDITEARRAQEELRKKDRAIRQAYVDVIAAVTGNKLILMTSEEIKEALGVLVTKPRRIGSYRSLARARAEIRTAIAYHFPEIRGTMDFIVGVCEGLTNAVKHGGSGRYEVRRRNSTAQVVISDRGPGVDFTTVPKATLEAGFSTQGTLGVGFTIMLEMSDRVLLSTEPGGTTLVLELSS